MRRRALASAGAIAWSDDGSASFGKRKSRLDGGP